jgi:hypothetical protein
MIKDYPNIIELDFSSGFPNLSLHGVEKALTQDGLIPPPIRNLILHHMKSPLIASSEFPTFETYVEHHENLA